MSSIRRTLLATLLAGVAAVSIAGVFATYRMARAQIDQLLDYHLRQIALSLGDRAFAVGPAVGGEGDLDFVIRIWDEDGERLYLSRPEPSLPPVARLGFSTVRTPDAGWRIYAVALGDEVVSVAQPLRVRETLAVQAALRTLSPLLVLLPLLAVLVWRVVGRGLAPLDRLAHAAAARSALALDPLPEEGAPEEVVPLVRSLNALLDRLRAALAAQRAFVADAAHELRTPLSALKLQAQLARTAAAGPEREAALAELDAGLERGARVVEQLLTLARMDPEAAPPAAGEPVRLADLVRQAVADHAVVAEARGVDLGATRVDEGAAVRADAAALRTLVANLVDNAVRYTPPGGRVDVSTGVDAGRTFVQIADTGPGIPRSERGRVFDRFYRLPGTDAAGSGLGLAIVKAIADRHGAEVSLSDTPGGGLTARVAFAPDRNATS